MTTLCLKTYAMKNTMTGKFILKGKGIPEWMMNKPSMLARAKWNGNERQFVYDDFVRCADEGKPFVYKAI